MTLILSEKEKRALKELEKCLVQREGKFFLHGYRSIVDACKSNGKISSTPVKSLIAKLVKSGLAKSMGIKMRPTFEIDINALDSAQNKNAIYAGENGSPKINILKTIKMELQKKLGERRGILEEVFRNMLENDNDIVEDKVEREINRCNAIEEECAKLLEAVERIAEILPLFSEDEKIVIIQELSEIFSLLL